MVALAAASLAGHVLQSLSLTGDAISKSRQIHASISGTLKEHDDLERLTIHFKDLSGRFVGLSRSFQALDDATNEGAQKILEALSDSRDQLVAATGSQTRQMRALHTQTETILSQEFKSAAANSVKQSEGTRALTAKEHQSTRAEVHNAVADVASRYDNAISTEADNISARIEEVDENTRAQIT
ncbi:hypothetical protein HO133_009163 [Letharia lupina]|uniref:Fungal N-terminal domain-containing protein n=1 Tax=Letharia lupina TaxID=560253 RepID=A0A8H6FF81_9LECA|nr:uncharacterized protein HO133_009163 [Letharia lupina]KAF6226297.1 hypothetical protein HO133_009163 [Letharia lupina]